MLGGQLGAANTKLIIEEVKQYASTIGLVKPATFGQPNTKATRDQSDDDDSANSEVSSSGESGDEQLDDNDEESSGPTKGVITCETVPKGKRVGKLFFSNCYPC